MQAIPLQEVSLECEPNLQENATQELLLNEEPPVQMTEDILPPVQKVAEDIEPPVQMTEDILPPVQEVEVEIIEVDKIPKKKEKEIIMEEKVTEDKENELFRRSNQRPVERIEPLKISVSPSDNRPFTLTRPIHSQSTRSGGTNKPIE